MNKVLMTSSSRSTRDRRNTFVDVTDRAERQSQVFSRKKSDMFVILDREDSLYTAGETVKGRVHIVLTQDVKVKDLVVRFYGFGRVSWDEQRSYIKGSAPSVLFKNSEVYLDYSTSLLKKDLSAILSTQHSTLTVPDVGSEEGIILPAGNHCFPFEYVLPRTLPSTYEGRWGQVKYVVKAMLQRPWKFDIDREADLSIKAYVDLNDEPELARPIGGLSEYAAGVMCIRSGPITVELRVGRRGYVPGETIQLSADVENNSRYKLYHCRMALMQHVTFRAGRKLRKTCVSVAAVEKDDILPMSTVQWNNDSLLVPALPPTTNKGHRNIEIRYTISLFVKYSSWTDAFCLPVAVSLGTVALRRQTINTYLAMLGYGQTPRGSPSTVRRASHTDTTPTAAGRSAARPSVSSPTGKTCEQLGRQPSNGNSSTGNTYGSTSNTTAAMNRDSPRNKSTPLSLEQPSPLVSGSTSGSPGSPVSPLGESVARRFQLGQSKAKNRSQDSGDSSTPESEKQQQPPQ